MKLSEILMEKNHPVMKEYLEFKLEKYNKFIGVPIRN